MGVVGVRGFVIDNSPSWFRQHDLSSFEQTGNLLREACFLLSQVTLMPARVLITRKPVKVSNKTVKEADVESRRFVAEI